MKMRDLSDLARRTRDFLYDQAGEAKTQSDDSGTKKKADQLLGTHDEKKVNEKGRHLGGKATLESSTNQANEEEHAAVSPSPALEACKPGHRINFSSDKLLHPVQESALPADSVPSGLEGGKEIIDVKVRATKNRPLFVKLWGQHLEKFVEDPLRRKFECSFTLNGHDRKQLHRLAHLYNLCHYSVGTRFRRRLIFEKDTFFYTISTPLPSAATLERFLHEEPKLLSTRDQRNKSLAQKHLQFPMSRTAFHHLEKHSVNVNKKRKREKRQRTSETIQTQGDYLPDPLDWHTPSQYTTNSDKQSKHKLQTRVALVETEEPYHVNGKHEKDRVEQKRRKTKPDASTEMGEDWFNIYLGSVKEVKNGVMEQDQSLDHTKIDLIPRKRRQKRKKKAQMPTGREVLTPTLQISSNPREPLQKPLSFTVRGPESLNEHGIGRKRF